MRYFEKECHFINPGLHYLHEIMRTYRWRCMTIFSVNITSNQMHQTYEPLFIFPARFGEDYQCH